jgi:imidazolonepropionase-like amidohydrolase
MRTLFAGGTVFDGSMASPAPADVVVEDGRVVDVGTGLDGDEVVDCTGRAVLPGWEASGCHLPAFIPHPGRPAGVADGPDEVRRKVREMIRAGADVIKVATSGGVLSAAKLMGLDKELGSLEPGKRADVVIVDGDPLDVSTLAARIRRVYQDGALVHAAPAGQAIAQP